MSAPTLPIMVVAKDYFTFHRWLNTKENQDQYIFVHGVNILEAYPEADGILLQDWANRNDAGEIHQWIEARKQNRAHQQIFTQLAIGLVPNTTKTLAHGGNEYMITHYDTHIIKFLNGAIYETL